MEKSLAGRCLAWALDFPGCFAEGDDETSALLVLPRVLLLHEAWINLHTPEPFFELGDFDFHVEEAYTVHVSPEFPHNQIHALFSDDMRRLSALEVAHALQIHTWQREELLAGLETLPEEMLLKSFEGENWTILERLTEIAKVEIDYLRNLNLPAPEIDKNMNPLELLNKAQMAIQKYLPTLTEKDMECVSQGEKWTPRKLLRSLLWSQRNHLDHIRKLASSQMDR